MSNAHVDSPQPAAGALARAATLVYGVLVYAGFLASSCT